MIPLGYINLSLYCIVKKDEGCKRVNKRPQADKHKVTGLKEDLCHCFRATYVQQWRKGRKKKRKNRQKQSKKKEWQYFRLLVWGSTPAQFSGPLHSRHRTESSDFVLVLLHLTAHLRSCLWKRFKGILMAGRKCTRWVFRGSKGFTPEGALNSSWHHLFLHRVGKIQTSSSFCRQYLTQEGHRKHASETQTTADF